MHHGIAVILNLSCVRKPGDDDIGLTAVNILCFIIAGHQCGNWEEEMSFCEGHQIVAILNSSSKQLNFHRVNRHCKREMHRRLDRNLWNHSFQFHSLGFAIS